MSNFLSRRIALALSLSALATPFVIRPAAARTAPRPTGFRMTRWRLDPFALGSYSFLAKGASPGDRDALGDSVDDRLYFAGEAMNRDNPATVHGAYNSGADAAEEIIDEGHRKVVIVGAGMSGLAAARALADEGIDVTVFEGRGRIGGRIWTDRSLGSSLDLGASWIHGVSGNPITKLADAVDAHRKPTDFESYIGRNDQGCEVDWDDSGTAYHNVSEIEHQLAADVSALSDEAEDEGEEARGAHVIFPGGYDQVFDALTSGIDIRLSQTVSAVSWTSQGVELTTPSGNQIADAVLVTVPLGVLKAGKIAFTPGLPQSKQSAINRLGMGLLDKVYLKFDQVFWDRDVEWIGRVGDDQRLFASWLNIAKYTGEPILMAFNASSGAERLMQMPEQRVVDMAVDRLSGMYGGCTG